MKPEAVVGAERILGSAATTWTRVTSGGWSANEHWIVELADGRVVNDRRQDRDAA